MTKTDPGGPGQPDVSAEIAAMRRSWNRRLAVNLFAVAAIVAYFTYPTWGRADFGATMLSILPVALGVAVLLVVINRWFVARQSRIILEAAGARRG